MCNFIVAQEGFVTYNQLDSLLSIEKYQEVIKHSRQKNLNLSKVEQAKVYSLIGTSYKNLNKEDSSLTYYQKALNTYEGLKMDESSIKIKSEIFELLKSQNNVKFNTNIYLYDIYRYALTKKSSKWMAYYLTNIGIAFLKKKDADSAKYYFNKALIIPKTKEDLIKKSNLYSLLGSLYSRIYKKQDSAIYFYNVALKTYYRDTLQYKNLNTEFNIFNNLGNVYRRSKNYKKALNYYNHAKNIRLQKVNRKSKKILFNNMSTTYYRLKDWEKAYRYLFKYDSIKNLINLKNQNILIAETNEKYNNEKLRADNLESETKRKQNQNLLIGALLFIFFGSITAYLFQKNTKKKQKLVEQEKALETQKLSTLLKEQELVNIDAMIQGQEKERQRIANDLHDDLGGLMATVKLHFNVLKNNQTPELYDKTNTLLNEAYHKIRSIAHAKNSGVIAKQGLLLAVKDMAEKISNSNSLNINIIDHGLENRLENSLELTIFRIIQELVTNVIKHANATETTIHLTNHEDTLNIMIEDNGTGFDTNQITIKNKGMGISSIDKRIEYLNGKMTIESKAMQGSTVIIDVPL